jgi:prephenate dehydratase
MSADVRFLGSYPRADRCSSEVKKGTANTEFAEAAGWLARIRSGTN